MKELFAELSQKCGLDPMKNGVVIFHAEGYKRGIASNHGDSEHLWGQLGLLYTMDGFRRNIVKMMGADSSGSGNVSDGMQAAGLKDLSEADVIARVGTLFAADQKKSGILASVSLAQFILECGYEFLCFLLMVI